MKKRNNIIEAEINNLLIEMEIYENPLRTIKKGYEKLTTTHHQRYNKELIKKIADLFDDPFAKFLEKTLLKTFKNEFIERLLVDAENGDKDAIEKIKSILLQSMISFYENAITARIFKTSITGDKTIDAAYKNAIIKIFNSNKIIDIFYDNVDKILPVEVEEIVDLMYEAKASKLKNAYRYVRHLGNKNMMLKYKISDRLLEYIPNVNKDLKKYVKNLVFSMDAKTMKALGVDWKVTKVANALSEPIINYIHNKITQKYLSGKQFKFFNGIVKDVIESEEMEKIFKIELKNAFSLKKLANA